nr:hypothetical protein [uncultured Halomonas sp.]
MKQRLLTFVMTATAAALLAGCSTGPTYHAQGGVSRIDPVVMVPRVSGSSSGGQVRAQAATQLGNRQLPASVSIRATTGPRGVEVAPVLRSKYINWRF